MRFMIRYPMGNVLQKIPNFLHTYAGRFLMRPRFVHHPNEHLNLINHVIYLHNLELDVISFHVLTQIKVKKNE